MPEQADYDSKLWVAKNQICELQRLYAIATDLLTDSSPQNITTATDIYRRIFTPQAEIHAAGVEPQIGPDAWVELVSGALEVFAVTQHSIGTQIAQVSQLPDGKNATGQGQLTSHLQAWHAKSDGDMWHFIGTYESSVTFSRQAGWQINEMHLFKVSEDYRKITPRP